MTTFFCFFSARVPEADGLGWDGQNYGKCAIDLVDCIRSGSLSTYTLGRLFPSAVIHAVFVLFNITANAETVVKAFSIWNLLAVWASLALWLDLCRHQNWQPTTTSLGAVALFFNFSVIRLPFYCPVATDVTALLFASLALWCFVIGKSALSIGLIFPAGMTWPVAAPVLACIAVLKNRSNEVKQGTPGRIFPAVCLAAFSMAAFYFLFVNYQPQPWGGAQVVYLLLPFSVVISACYVYWASHKLGLQAAIRNMSIDWATLIIVAVTISAYAVGRMALSGVAGPPAPMSVGILIRGLTVTGLVYPALSFVAHVLFLGPWILIFIAFIPRILEHVISKAVPLYPIILLVLVFLLLSESRGMTFFLPFAIFALCLTINGAISEKRLIIFSLMSLLLSHFWLPMRTGQFGNLLEFPAQILFMHIGPWMGWPAYVLGVLQLAIALLVVAPMIKEVRRDGLGL